MKIKRIEWQEGKTFEGWPKLTANLPFGYFAIIRPVGYGYNWRIQQKTTKVIFGESDCIQDTINDCNKAWEEIVMQALEVEL